jgi:hypothetical protein
MPHIGDILEHALNCNRSKKDEKLDLCIDALDFKPLVDSFVTHVVTEKNIPAIANIITYTVHIMLKRTDVPITCSSITFDADEWRNNEHQHIRLKKAIILATRMVVDGDCNLDVEKTALDTCKRQ